jgi:hypothetical protein
MRIDSGREDTALYAAGSGQIKIARWNLDSGLEIKLDPVVGPFRWPAKGRKNSADELEDLAEPVPRAQRVCRREIGWNLHIFPAQFLHS